MAVNFPNSPAVNDQVTISGRLYEWDGQKWNEITQIDKANVGLGNVSNFGIASDTEAEAGTTNDKYMTPLRTAEAIAVLSPPTDVSTEFAAGVIETNNDSNLKFWKGTQAEFNNLTPELIRTYESPEFTGSVQFPTTFQTTIPYAPIAFDGNFNNNFASYISGLKFYVTFDGETEPILFYDGLDQSAGSFENVINTGWSSLTATFGSFPDLGFSGARSDSVSKELSFTAFFGFNSQTSSSGNFLFLTPINAADISYIITVEQYGLNPETEFIVSDTPKKATVDYFTLTINDFDWSGTSPTTSVKMVTGILSTDRPLIDLDLSGITFANIEAIEAEYAKIYQVEATDANEITFYAKEALSESVTLNIKVVR